MSCKRRWSQSTLPRMTKTRVCRRTSRPASDRSPGKEVPPGNVRPRLMMLPHRDPACAAGPWSSAHPQQLDLEDQVGVRRDDAAGAAGAVAELGGDGELALASHLHTRHALVPALDDLPRA